MTLKINVVSFYKQKKALLNCKAFHYLLLNIKYIFHLSRSDSRLLPKYFQSLVTHQHK